jgi:hypothetical protein
MQNQKVEMRSDRIGLVEGVESRPDGLARCMRSDTIYLFYGPETGNGPRLMLIFLEKEEETTASDEVVRLEYFEEEEEDFFEKDLFEDFQFGEFLLE